MQEAERICNQHVHNVDDTLYSRCFEVVLFLVPTVKVCGMHMLVHIMHPAGFDCFAPLPTIVLVKGSDDSSGCACGGKYDLMGFLIAALAAYM